MKKNKSIWGKGDKFKYKNNKYHVIDVVVDTFYQTDFTRTWLKFQERGDKYTRWIDSIYVEALEGKKHSKNRKKWK